MTQKLWVPNCSSTQPGQRPVTTCVYKSEAANTVWSSWWWALCRSKHVEPSINFGKINSITRLHLAGSFYWFILRCTDPWILNTSLYWHLVFISSYNNCTCISHPLLACSTLRPSHSHVFYRSNYRPIWCRVKITKLLFIQIFLTSIPFSPLRPNTLLRHPKYIKTIFWVVTPCSLVNGYHRVDKAFCFALVLCPVTGDRKFFRNADTHLQHYMASRPARPLCWYSRSSEFTVQPQCTEMFETLSLCLSFILTL